MLDRLELTVTAEQREGEREAHSRVLVGCSEGRTGRLDERDEDQCVYRYMGTGYRR